MSIFTRNYHRVLRISTLPSTARSGCRSYSSLKNKVIAISGAASGIGLATAKTLFPLGTRLSLADNRASALEAALPEITTSSTIYPPTNVLTCVTDVRSSDQVDSWIQQTVDKFGTLDGAANIAGVTHKNNGISDIIATTNEEWDFINDINLRGTFYALRAQLRAMKALSTNHPEPLDRSIVNLSSTAGLEGNARNANYSASKHGVIGLSRSAAKEVGCLGIRVNAVAPGIIDTPMVQGLAEKTLGDRSFLLEHNQALNRRARPDEVSNLVAWLLCEDSTFVTGAVYTIDGGQLC